MSGEARGPGPALLRGLLGMAEPVYTWAIGVRNRRFDRGVGVHRLPRPVISVGNITAGGTGKTPVVQWLCQSLRTAGMRPAVLMRGYKSRGAGGGDEQLLLNQQLNEGAATASPPIVIHADPDRVRGGQAVLREHPETDVLVLDDGFQHRRLARDFDLVLIDAANPFGYGHVHPRGLLREPIDGLKRADAILITRSNEGEATITGEVYRCDHLHTGFRSGDRVLPLDALIGRRYFSFCGIGNPESFGRQLGSLGGVCVGQRWFGDHHAYRESELAELKRAARAAGAEVLLTTEKDWVKIAPLAASAGEPEIWRVELAIRFRGDDEQSLLQRIKDRIGNKNTHTPGL